MKYLILRKVSRLEEDPFVTRVARKEEEGPELPFAATSDDLDNNALADARREPEVVDIIPSTAFMLVRPVSVSESHSADRGNWGLAAVGATTSPYDGKGVTIAVLDTGIDTNHPTFCNAKDRLNFMDFTVDEKGKPGSAPDFDGHGTHVAGTIFGCAVGNTRIGVAPGVKRILIGKVLGAKGGTTEAIYNAIAWAIGERADIITMSLSIDFPGAVARLIKTGLPPDIASSRALEEYRSNVRLFDRIAASVESLVDRGRGALLVAASGNESRRKENPQFTVAVAPPAAADGFLSVGALSRVSDTAASYVVSSFSNTGCMVAAPGDSILSAKAGTKDLVAMSGTSMATPHVAGVLALWTEKLFPNGERPKNWAKHVTQALERHVAPCPGQLPADVGQGLVQAPQSDKAGV